MTDSGTPFLDGSAADGATRQSAESNETLQEALRSLAGGQPSSVSPSALTPDAILDLARRVGLTSPGQVADLSRIMGTAAGNAAGADLAGVPQHIVFALDQLECALPAQAVQGVERIGEITSVPNTVPWVLGVIHIRGAILSVVDLRGFLGLPTQPVTPRSRLLVVTNGDMTIGMVVDAVTEMRPLGGSAEVSGNMSTPDWALPYAQRTVNVEGRTVVLLDPERLLTVEKMHRYRADFG